ncbi:aminopeptidase [Brevibacillus fluminis]|uniref:aminopeptidase n=1 Tax=Brevibacillus fluminis TaxID=511487 RepID=UPI003F8B7230
MDIRLQKLAKNIVHHSTNILQNENVLIEAFDVENDLVQAVVREVQIRGGNPFVNIRDNQIIRTLLMNATEQQVKTWTEIDAHQMNRMDAYIGIRGSKNIYEFSDIPPEKLHLYHQIYQKEVHINTRVKHTKWVVLRFPDPSVAQLAKMSTEAFEEFFYNVCTMDYERMSKAMDTLVDVMNQTDKVRIVGPGTDLTFSIKDIPAIKCAGELNLPDGEVYTAPVKESVNGTISYNTPSPYNGFVFEKIVLTFDNGKIVKATANDTERINRVFDTDEGARFVGEFAIGVNPYIKKPMNDVLFDEKIDGSIHFTPGQAYDNADNGNRSSIHWDMVLIQRPEYGGGEIWFDDRLIRKDGRFVVPELEGLNPENLMN